MELTQNSYKERTSLDSLVLLRGIAVLMVCFSHFGDFIIHDHTILEKGNYGVHIFFIISGFVIPFSLIKGNYSLSHYPQFIYKRFLRLHPPYLVALAGTILLIYFKHFVYQLPLTENTGSILKSLVYAHWPVENPVFWTLLVEAEYYIFIGVFFVVAIRYYKITFFILIPCLLLLSRMIPVTSYIYFLPFIVFFLIGMVGLFIYKKIGYAFINYVALLGLLIFTAIIFDVVVGVISLATIGFILTYRNKIPSIFKFPGKISYSIYLIHYPLGAYFMQVIGRRISPNLVWLKFVVMFAFIFILSWIFYKCFEEYFEGLSKKVKYQ
ncbi:MAG: acyltransferase [Ferruginibacter sp.]